MPHLTCAVVHGISFLLLFVFLISPVHHHPAVLYRRVLILDRLLAFLVAFSTLILKLSFSQSIFLHSHLSHLPKFCRSLLWQLLVASAAA